MPPTELQRSVVAPPPWHSRRLPPKLAQTSLLEGDSWAREKAEEDERLRWAGEVADLLVGLANLTKGKASTRTESGSNTDVRQSARSDSLQLRPILEAFLELVDCDGRRTTAEKLRRSARLPGTQGGRALHTVRSQEAPSGTRLPRRSGRSNNNERVSRCLGSANKLTRWKERSWHQQSK